METIKKSEFLKIVKNVCGPRTHKITNSYGVYDAYKYYRKTKVRKSKYNLNESDYFAVIREFNKNLIDVLLTGSEVPLPLNMGSLQVRKHECGVTLKDGEVKITYPIDWDKTLDLWYNDENARDRKILIHREVGEIFRVLYIKSKAKYKNKTFYTFSVNREIKKLLKLSINNNQTDAFLINK